MSNLTEDELALFRGPGVVAGGRTVRWSEQLTRLCGAPSICQPRFAQPQFDELWLVDEVVTDVQRTERLVVSG